MPPAAPPLPTQFPCWCKAVYSWGGETKRDLGFIEGDLIECLNAGDGAWWMGRLKRDRRAVGLFPSNFVELLDESLWPGNSRNTTPNTAAGGSISRAGSNQQPAKPTPQKTKSTFRKPFQAYYNAGSPNPAAAARERLERSGAGTVSSNRTDSLKKHRPYSSMKHATPPGPSPNPSPRNSNENVSRVPPLPDRGSSGLRNRAPSPLPPRQEYSQYRAVSPAPPQPADYRPTSRAISPAPPQQYRAVSPAPPQQYRAVSPAPPQQYRAVSPAPPQQYRPSSRAVSPAPPQQYYPPSPGLPPATPQQQYRAYSPGVSPTPDMQYGQYRETSRGPSPAPFEPEFGEASPPPPPPPPHRVLNRQLNRAPSPAPYQPSREPSPAPFHDGYRSGGYHTPGPPSPAPRQSNNLTPSPLTNAMNDVMTSLEDMSLSRRDSSPTRARTPADIWSPEAFDEVYSNTTKKIRPNTSLGLGIEDDEQHPGGLTSHKRSNSSFAPQPDGPPQIGNYVQRMEERLRQLHGRSPAPLDELFLPTDQDGPPPAPPPKNPAYSARPQTSFGENRPETMYETRSHSSMGGHGQDGVFRKPTLKHRKSAYEIAKQGLGRTFTTKTNATNSTEATNSTNHTLWSGTSVGGASVTSAGSFARRKWGIGGTIRESRERSKSVIETSRPRAGSRVGSNESRPETPFSGGVSYHSSHATSQQQNSSNTDWTGHAADAGGLLGGLTAPRAKRTGFFKKMIESAKANAATARNTISSSPSRPASRGANRMLPNGITSISGGTAVQPSSPAKDMGLGGSVDWVQVRRDVNRSNSLSKNERIERAERCQMNDIAVINPIEVLQESIEGDEGLDGLPVDEPTDFSQCNLGLVDKNARFIQGLPPMTTPASLAQGYVCRPYRSDVQRLRAIFTWVAERISWEEDYEGDINTRHVIQTKRGCSEEIAVLVMEMCAAVGLHAEVVRGYLKAPGEILDFDMVAHPNHWWNAVIVDGEWRIMDCSLASPTNPRRAAYSSASTQVAESGFFLARPSEICYTHVPLLPEQQHIVPPMAHEVLMALPCACPPYFRDDVQIVDFDTSVLNLENLEMAHVHFFVPEDIEAVAEVEARVFVRDGDGDFFESGDVCRKRALCQPEWIGGRKRYTVKALLPGDEGQATLKVYAGKRGLMHSIKSNPHPLAFALPLMHTGQNPPYDFVTIHPTPHAQRHDLYVAQPQCSRLACNNTFVFAVRQHPSSLSYPMGASHHAASASTSSAVLSGRISPNPFTRPTSALSMVSASASNAGSVFSASSSNASDNKSSSSGSALGGAQKPAKLAIQSPSGKIIRLMRKSEHMLSSSNSAGVGGASDGEREGGDGSVWETVIKIGERGTWRGLVLADRSARWCVFAEWECF